jgi:glycosyltransferase involved in cell wall biosynthesis
MYTTVSENNTTTCQVSVIVPIYKAEQTLLRCLDSLKAQTYTDFEVLMVDDGSPDRCGEMIDDYAQNDSRFRAFHKENGGVSSARQFGIDHAIGEYTIHADPDDWVEPTMLEDLYRKAKEEDADMVICDFYENTYKGQRYVKQQPTTLNSKDVLHDVFLGIHGSTCNKLIRRRMYDEYGVQFPIGISMCEDQYVVASFLKHEINVAYLPQAYYHYVRELKKNSLSKSYNEQTYQQDLLRRELFDDLLKDDVIRQDVYEKISYGIVSRAFYYGSQFYSSRLFKEHFHSYKGVVKKSSVSISEKTLVLLSCYGYYKIAFIFLNVILFFKHKLC